MGVVSDRTDGRVLVTDEASVLAKSEDRAVADDTLIEDLEEVDCERRGE